MRFNFDDYAHDSRYAMHCPTTEDAKVFLSYLKSIGKTWCTGADYLDPSHIEAWTPYYLFVRGMRTASGTFDGFVLEFSDFEWTEEDDIPDTIKITLDDMFV